MGATRVKVVRQTTRQGDLEPVEFMIKRFQKAYQEAGVLADLRKHEYALSPMQKKREKAKIAEARRIKEQRKTDRYIRSDPE